MCQQRDKFVKWTNLKMQRILNVFSFNLTSTNVFLCNLRFFFLLNSAQSLGSGKMEKRSKVIGRVPCSSYSHLFGSFGDFSHRDNFTKYSRIISPPSPLLFTLRRFVMPIKRWTVSVCLTTFSSCVHRQLASWEILVECYWAFKVYLGKNKQTIIKKKNIYL